MVVMVMMARMMMVARAGLVVMTWQRIRLGTNYQPLHCEDTDGKGQTQMKYKLKYKTTLEHTNQRVIGSKRQQHVFQVYDPRIRPAGQNSTGANLSFIKG